MRKPAVAGADINQQNIRSRTQRGGTRPGAGRPPGSKNKKLSVKGPRTDRVIVALSDCASPPANIKKSRRGIERMAPAKAPEGIAPKDVLLTSMRNAWELAHQKAALVEEVEREIIILVKAKAETLSSDSKNTIDEKIANLRAKIVALKIEIGLHLNAAQGLAKDVAPYEHPKVAQQDSKVIGNLTIVRRKF